MKIIIIPSVVTVRVDIPALTDLVSYLRSQSQQQGEIDALTAQVRDLTNGLNQSTSGLKTAVQENE